jgi:hypothetical protein
MDAELIPKTTSPLVCPQCHQSVQPEWYFCPNCGKRLSDPPLATDIGTQLWIYVFSAVLPIICYLAIGYWPGIKYARSQEPQARAIGWISIAIISISTIITFWLAIVWVNSAVQSATNSLGNLGGL